MTQPVRRDRRSPARRPGTPALGLALSLALALVSRAEDRPRAPDEPDWGTIARVSRALTLRGGDNRPDDAWTPTLFGRPVLVSGEAELRSRYRDAFHLDEARKDDDAKLEPKLELELFTPLTRSVSLFLEAKASYDADVYAQEGSKETVWQVERGETWIHWQDLAESGLSLRLGRQNFQDEREWWWDRDLDAVRATFELSDFEFELAAGQELLAVDAVEGRVDAALEDVLFVLGRGSWFWGEDQRLDLFWARRRDGSETSRPDQLVRGDREDDRDADLSWIGLRAMGRFRARPLGRFFYWADTAAVRGDETELDFDDLEDGSGRSRVTARRDRRVRGWAFDTGVTWEPRRGRWPRLTLGYALGSGDGRPDEGTDGSFRQTGLQDNNTKFRGVDRFKVYGELFRPELSNLHVATVSVGIPILRHSSIELVFHDYRQARVAPFLRETRLKASPEGRRRHLGREWDLVLGLEEWTHWEIELVAARFEAGAAFGDRDGEVAHLGLLKIDFNF